MRLTEAIAEFYEEQDYKGNAPATLNFYKENFDHFLKDTGITTLDEFTEPAIRAWLMEHKDLSRTTIATYDRAIRVLANWLHLRGHIPTHPMAKLVKPRVPRHAPMVVFSPDEVKGMLRAAHKGMNPLRDKALVHSSTRHRHPCRRGLTAHHEGH